MDPSPISNVFIIRFVYIYIDNLQSTGFLQSTNDSRFVYLA